MSLPFCHLHGVAALTPKSSSCWQDVYGPQSEMSSTGENAAVFLNPTALCFGRIIPFVLTPNGALASSVDSAKNLLL